MTTTYTMSNGETVTYKELQIVAKDFGIKANQKAAVLLSLIEEAAKPVKEITPTTTEDDEYAAFMDEDWEEPAPGQDATDFIMNGRKEQSASEASAPVKTGNLPDTPANEVSSPTYTKAFEYVRSNNLGVVFMQKGVQVKIGWDPALAKPFIKVGNQPRKIMSIQTAIDKFKRFENEVHGDVARIVKALVRVRKMPAQVLAQLKQRKRAEQ